ncbi:MAG: T9SS type A sorting domain-containing protein [Flavobacterium sp.]|uniref:DUF7619 domain-containing protein n=1 Tax=Flavobacterium sp. TaxID=239 RepID=UPI0032677DE9
MKKYYILFILLLSLFAVNAQIINIPDAIFKAKLVTSTTENGIAYGLDTLPMAVDSNADGEIEVSEAAQVKFLYLNQYSISSLEGIQYFNNITSLYCHHNLLTSLDVSALANLTWLECDSNNLTSLNVSGLNNLARLVCSYNQLTTLDVSGLQSLQNLNCYNNPQLTSLNASNAPHLETIGCFQCQLNSLNVSGDVNLNYLHCTENQLTSLDVSGLTNLQTLYCSDNNLSTLNVSGATFLYSLLCDNNHIQTLDLEGMHLLGYLGCSNNELTSLVVSYTTYQLFLNCSNNLLTSLDIKNGVTETSLDFSGNPDLHYLCADDNEITTVQNKVLEYGYANCVLNSYCTFTPGGPYSTIEGNTKFDLANDGCDASDSFAPNVRFSVTNSATISSLVSDISGHYELPIENGTHVIAPQFENPSYYTASPANVSVTFPATPSPFTQDFCIRPNGNHNDLEVVILPLGPAVPGFDIHYGLLFRNKGTTVQNGVVNLSYSDAILDLVSTVPLFSNQSTDMLSWNFNNLQPFESRYINVTFNLNSSMDIPPVINGELLNYEATIIGATDETPIDNIASLVDYTVVSLDPNDKTCLEGDTVSPAMVGEYVHYIIRFENTGTFAAQNVVVTDEIDLTRFNINSLVPQQASHDFVTRIKNNKVEFIFENINLPFDDANNDGYVAFKIKTKPTLVVGDTFSNTANIYFDYNFPIITNAAATTIQTLGNQDFEFNSVFSLSPVPAKNVLNIAAKQSVTISSVTIYNTLGQLIQVNTNPNETIDVSGLKTGSYFIKIISDKGTAGSKFIKE